MNMNKVFFDKSATSRFAGVIEQSIEASSIKINNVVYELKQKGQKVIVLSLGEAFFDIPLHDMNSLPYPDIYHYSHSRGILELRKKITDYYQNYYGVKINPAEEMLITAGSKVVIYFALRSILNPGDEVILPEPCWVSYPEQIKYCYAKPVHVPYWESVFDYSKYITKKTKLIIINNPNNPSGKVYTKEELEFLVDLAQKHGLYILSDEAYSDFVVDEKFYSLGLFDESKRNTIICNSISKNFGISGWRVGYVITHHDLIYQILKLNQHIITCPATILEHYLIKYFDDVIRVTYPQIKAVVQKRKRVARLMETMGIRYLPGTGTFYFFVSIAPTKLTSDEFCWKLLREDFISTVPGIGYGYSCDSFIRVSIGTESIKDITYALNKIKELIEKTS